MRGVMANSAADLIVRNPNFGRSLFFGVASASASTSLVSFPLNCLPNRRGFRLSSGYMGVDVYEKPRRLRVLCFGGKSRDESLDLPLLPFPPDEVMVPSEFKTLHLYEARFLALLEESMDKGQYQFVHFVLDPLPSNPSSTELSYAARHACLVFIEKVEKLDIGALVSIRGVGRVDIIDITQSEPYLRGTIVPMQDRADRSEGETISKVAKLKESLVNLNNLEIKLKTPKDEPLQTRIRSSVIWAENEDSGLYNPAFLPAMPERVSFAALQPVSGSTQTEVLALQKRKLWAMATRDTSERLSNALELVKHNVALLAAKLAIQSVEI
ncbi:ATP-dependent protease La (LON) domain protein [Wolffia australiana]